MPPPSIKKNADWRSELMRLVIRHRLTQCTMHWRRARRARAFPIVAGTEGPIEWEAEDCSGPDAAPDSAASEMCHRVRAVLSDRLYNAVPPSCRRADAHGNRLANGHQPAACAAVDDDGRNQVRQCFPHWTTLVSHPPIAPRTLPVLEESNESIQGAAMTDGRPATEPNRPSLSRGDWLI
jgi:hypothetical protein